MSDPVSSMDVEDVLSSIRRLVSEEAKATEPSRESPQLGRQPDIHEEAENAAREAVSQINDAPPTDQTGVLAGVPPSNEISPPQPDADQAQVSFRHKTAAPRPGVDKKLVLTAALRVAEAENNPPQALDGDVAEPSVTPERPKRPGRPHLRSVSDDAIMSGGAGEGAEVGVDAQTKNEIDHSLGGVSRSNKLDFAPEDTLFERAKRAMESVKSTPVEPPAYVFNPEVKPTAPEVAQRPVSFAPAPLNEMPMPEQSVDEDQNDAETTVPTTVPTEAEPTPQPDEAAAETGPSASPFSPGGGALDPTQTDTKSDLEDDLPSVNFVEEEESILDEETLRDMVSQMVREELQGELGDRITRNVRKLVRREIQRALASREFE